METIAVEWLVEQLKNGKEFNDNLIEQAKEMDKRQIIDALHYFGIENAEQYYNETFKTNG
jgi:uncharacterized protein (DUF433 family)